MRRFFQKNIPHAVQNFSTNNVDEGAMPKRTAMLIKTIAGLAGIGFSQTLLLSYCKINQSRADIQLKNLQAEETRERIRLTRSQADESESTKNRNGVSKAP